MKKLPRKFLVPIMIALMMPTMLLGMPAIMTYRNLPEGASFLSFWLDAVAQVVPPAIVLIVIAAPIYRLFVTKVLLEPKPEA